MGARCTASSSLMLPARKGRVAILMESQHSCNGHISHQKSADFFIIFFLEVVKHYHISRNCATEHFISRSLIMLRGFMIYVCNMTQKHLEFRRFDLHPQHTFSIFPVVCSLPDLTARRSVCPRRILCHSVHHPKNLNWLSHHRMNTYTMNYKMNRV